MGGQPGPGGAPATQKTSEIIGNLRPAKQFKLTNTDAAVTSLCFDDSGEFLLAACSDEALQLYNAREGTHSKTLLSQKYGAHLARFTHHAGSIIYASTKGDDTIRYLSTHDNMYLRYFRGHTAPVTCLALCPGSDSFVSCGQDDAVRLWDLSSPHPQGKLALAAPTLAAYEPSATVLAVASPATSCVLLYDLRNYDQPPFATFDLRRLDARSHIALHGAQHPRDWTRLDFSNDGKFLLLATTSSAGHILLDAYSGELAAFLVRPAQHLPLNPARQRPAPFPPAPAAPAGRAKPVPGQGDACFSADGRYVIGASGGERDGVVWDLQAEPLRSANPSDLDDPARVLRPVASLPCKGKVAVCEWNPRYNMLASGDKEVVMWLPDEHVGMKPP